MSTARTRRIGKTMAFTLICAGLWLAWAPASWSEPGTARSIAVLEFELNDLTPLPATPEELARTAAIRPLVEQALKERGERLIAVPAAAQALANVGFGYLYDHPEAAAQLGRTQGADWVLVGRLHKPSFLFAYLLGRLVNCRSGQVAANLVVEAKGPAEQVTRRAAARLAEQLDQALAAPTTRPNAQPSQPNPAPPAPP
jgi:hypothetical protein